MSEEIKIEKGFEIPTARRHGKYQSVVEKLEVGDSVEMSSLSDANSFATCMSRNNMVGSRRRQEDGTYRVWRIK